jgi:hypothetical protein
LSTPNAESVSHAHTSAHAAHAGEIVLDRYHLVRRIGAGGMGVVYLARDEHLERDVAVKRIAIELDREGRGEREARAAARLSHPGIVALYEAGRDEDAIYLVSELVLGRTLAELIRDGELSDRDVVLIGMTLCDALEHAHSRGVVHRDVKPSNIICPDSNEDGAGVAKLTDFGIALMAGGDVLTRTGDIMGTLAYMAPEQAAGRGATGAADVYALGVVLYEGLSGVNPIRAGNPAATARRVGTRLPPLQRVRRDLPAGLCRAIDAAVMPEPEQRAGVDALRVALSRALDAVADDAGPIDTKAGFAQTARMRRFDFEPAEFDDGAGVRARRLRSRPPASVAAPDVRASQWRAGDARRPAGHAPDHGSEPRRRPPRWPLRAVAAGAAAGLAAAALSWLGAQPPVDPAAGSLAAGAVVLLLPRLGWLTMVVTLLAWLAVTAPGTALLVGIAAAPVPFLLPRRGAAWSLPAIAPALGAIGLAGAWPALAGQARSWPARAALGALGGLWLVLAEALASERLLFGQPRDVLALGAWQRSAIDATRDALVPIWSGGTLAIAALWALFAAVLPLLVRGRSAALDLVATAGWAAALAAGTGALGQALMLDPPRGAVLGALAGGVLAVGLRAARGRV